MAERRYGAPATPTESEVRHEDWACDDISGQEHTRVAFHDVDLTEVVNQGASFTECTFSNCRFNVSAHTDAAFVNCTFTNCSFFDATFTGCKMVGSMFDRCTFGLLKVRGGDWSFVGLPGADLSKSEIVGVRMRECDLTAARCTDATLRHTDLSGALLHRADLSRTDLRGSELSTLDPLAASLRGAVIDPDQAAVLAQALGLDVRPALPPPGD
jgi:fluoroquinolone resistance protein